MPRKGERASSAQRAALKRGQKKRHDAQQEGVQDDTAKQRWSKLLDGTLTVADLTDEEIDKNRVHGKGGLFNGVPQRLPSHLVLAFRSEQVRRTRAILSRNGRPAAEGLLALANDPTVPSAVRARCLSIVLDHSIGKAPETVHVIGEDRWGKVMDASVSDDRVMMEDDARDLVDDG